MFHVLCFLMAFSYYKSVTIDHTQCGTADSTDFPVAIWITDTDLKTVGNGGFVQNSNGYDIRPYADSGLTVPLTFELVAGTYVASTGALEMHVKLFTVSHSSDTLFYLAFGDSGISTDGSSTSTWNSAYKSVYHCSTLGADSTANTDTLTYHGSVASPPGAAQIGLDTASPIVGPSYVFDNAATQLGNYADNATTTLRVTGDYTVETWIKMVTVAQFPLGNTAALSQWSGGSGWMLYLTDTGSFNQDARIYADGNFAQFLNIFASDQAWHHIVAVKSGSNGTLYVDGVSLGTVAIGSSTISDPSTPLNVGQYNNGTGNDEWDAYDERRLSNSVRDASWVTASYNNQKSASTFLTFGAKTPVGGASTDTSWMPRYSWPYANYKHTILPVP